MLHAKYSNIQNKIRLKVYFFQICSELTFHLISRNKVDRSGTPGCLQCHHCIWQCIPLLVSQETNKKQHCPQGQYYIKKLVKVVKCKI